MSPPSRSRGRWCVISARTYPGYPGRQTAPACFPIASQWFFGKHGPVKIMLFMVRSEGFEPPTPRFEVWCSIRLSYERAARCHAARSCDPLP
jgi:hypothetical protein